MLTSCYPLGPGVLISDRLRPSHPSRSPGFSLDSGHTLTRGPGVTIVAGAPRAHHSGAVVLLRKESEGSTRLSPEFILQGPGLASSFGYDVTVVDLNGDG